MFRFIAFSTRSRRTVALWPHANRLARVQVRLRRLGRGLLRTAAVVVQHVLLAPMILASLLVCGVACLIARALATREPAITS